MCFNLHIDFILICTHIFPFFCSLPVLPAVPLVALNIYTALFCSAFIIFLCIYTIHYQFIFTSFLLYNLCGFLSFAFEVSQQRKALPIWLRLSSATLTFIGPFDASFVVSLQGMSACSHHTYHHLHHHSHQSWWFRFGFLFAAIASAMGTDEPSNT